MRRTIVAAATAAFVLAGSAAHAELVVNISKSQQRVAVVVDGHEAYRWPVSTGRRGFVTPSGVYRPERLERHWYSHKYENSPMPWSVFFYRGYALHGTMEAYHLGRAASHGCVRLRPDHARTLFGLVQRVGARHTKIVVLDGALPQGRPADAPVAKAAPETPALHHFAKAADEHRPASRHLGARGHTIHARHHTVRYRAWQASDEARILRAREAWLRSLDRRYGIDRE